MAEMRRAEEAERRASADRAPSKPAEHEIPDGEKNDPQPPPSSPPKTTENIPGEAFFLDRENLKKKLILWSMWGFSVALWLTIFYVLYQGWRMIAEIWPSAARAAHSFGLL
jgi:hypothetical protein